MTPDERRALDAERHRTARAADPEKYQKAERARRATDPSKFRERDRRRRAADPEKFHERDARRRQAHLEERRARDRAHYAANRERLLALKREYYMANLELFQIRNRAWRLNHPDAIKKNPERNRQDSRKRRARIRGGVTEPYLDLDIFERDGWVCQLCRKKVDKRLAHPHPRSKTIDHIVPIVLGGADSPANVQLAHRVCNLAKHVKALGEQLRLI